MNEFRNFFDPTATGDYVKTRKDIVNELKLSGLKPKITITDDSSFIDLYYKNNAKIIGKNEPVQIIKRDFKVEEPWWGEDIYEAIKEKLDIESRYIVTIILDTNESDYGKLKDGKLKNNIKYFNEHFLKNNVFDAKDLKKLKNMIIKLDEQDAEDDIENVYGNRLSRIKLILDKIKYPEFFILNHDIKNRKNKEKFTNWGNHDISLQYLPRNPIVFLAQEIYNYLVINIYESAKYLGYGKISVIVNTVNIMLYGPCNQVYIDNGYVTIANNDYGSRTIAVLRNPCIENLDIKDVTLSQFINYNAEALQKIRNFITKYEEYAKKDNEDMIISLKIILREWVQPTGSGKSGHELALFYKNSIVDPFIDNGYLCGHACLVMALMYINNPGNVKNLKDSKKSTLTNLAIKYSNTLGIKRPLTYTDFDLFVEKCRNGEFGIIDNLPNPNIVITIMTSMNDDQPYRTEFKNPENINYVTHWIYILHFNNHYQYIVDIENFAKPARSRKTWCHWCCKLYTAKEMRRHPCCLKCGNCNKIFMTLDERESHIVKCDERCNTCHFRYQHIGCKENHVCGYHQCLKCDTIYNPKLQHICNHKHCVHCDIQYPKENHHRCYIKKVKAKKDYKSIWCYDIESLSNMVSPGVYHNNPALMVTMSLDTRYCLVFESLKLFIKWVNTGEIGTSNRIKLQTFGVVRIFSDWNDIEYSPKLRSNIDLKPKLLIAHNGASYDTYLAIKEIKADTVQEIKNIVLDGQKIISMTFSGCKFIDSRKHISSSLPTMAKTFSLKSHKGYFPYRFFNTANKNYIGPIPSQEYFNTSSYSSDKEFMEWYNEYTSGGKVYDIWEECIKYCTQDVLLLVECMEKYKTFGIEMTNLNPLNYLTISSYSQAIYRYGHYLQEGDNENNPIGILTRTEYEFSRKAFFGGRTDARCLHVKSRKNGVLGILAFDVNGLYSTVQTYDPLPYGDTWWGGPINGANKCKQFIKNLHKENKCAIIECNITCPKDLYQPVLPEKIDGKLTFHLNITSGSWTSYELEVAISKGYVVKNIINSLCSKTCTKLFATYMNKFISLKEKYGKDSPDRNDGLCALAKMFSSGLWGKFGQRDINTFTKFFSGKKLDEWHRLIGQYNNDKIADINVHEVNNDYIYATITPTEDENLNLKTTNVMLAAFITSHARLRLFVVLDKYGARIAYHDTDSVYIIFSSEEEMNSILKDMDIGSKLGQWKNETITRIDGVDYLNPIIELIALGPKTYAKKSMLGDECVKSKGFNDKSFTFSAYKQLVKIFIKNGFTNTTKLTSTQLHFRRGCGSGKDSIYTYDNYVKNLIVSLQKFYIQSPMITLPFGHKDIPI